MHPGLHLVHKPVGVTSFSLVQALMDEIARSGDTLPICHAGTLDPFAEGLLLILAGPATKLMELIHAVPKVYVADVAWGRETDNGDLLGRALFEGDPSGLTPATLDAALPAFLGWQDQVPPATSAKKVGGEPAYKKAHRGEVVVLPPSRVFLHEARWLSHDLPHASRLWLQCRGGYYVRALARDLGRALGCGAHVRSLVRTDIGPWHDPKAGERVQVDGEGLLPWLASRLVTRPELDLLRQGRTIARGEVREPDWRVPEGFPPPQGPIRALHGGRLVAMLRDDGANLFPSSNIRGGM